MGAVAVSDVEIVEFLRAQIAEDERVAKEASVRSRKWRLVTPLDDQEAGDAWWLNPPELAHADRHDPARVLAEVDAKRRILDDILAETHLVIEEDCWFTCGAATEERDGGHTCSEGKGDRCDCGRDARVERRLRLLALLYAEHPDYRPEWAPE